MFSRKPRESKEPKENVTPRKETKKKETKKERKAREKASKTAIKERDRYVAARSKIAQPVTYYPSQTVCSLLSSRVGARLAAQKAVDESVASGPLSRAEVTARIECSEAPEVFSIGKTASGATLQLRYAYLCQRGYYPDDLFKANQDSFKSTAACHVSPQRAPPE